MKSCPKFGSCVNYHCIMCTYRKRYSSTTFGDTTTTSVTGPLSSPCKTRPSHDNPKNFSQRMDDNGRVICIMSDMLVYFISLTSKINSNGLLTNLVAAQSVYSCVSEVTHM